MKDCITAPAPKRWETKGYVGIPVGTDGKAATAFQSHWSKQRQQPHDGMISTVSGAIAGSNQKYTDIAEKVYIWVGG